MASIPSFTPGTATQQSALLFGMAPSQWSVYQITAQTVTSTASRMLWQDSLYDTDPTSWSSGNSGQVYINTPGTWRLTVNVLLMTTATAGTRELSIRKNSGGSNSAGTRFGIDERYYGSGFSSLAWSGDVPGFAVNDYIEVFVTSSVSIQTLPGNFVGAVGMSGIWIGPN